MIGQYLPNNNENSYSAILQKFLHLNQPLIKAKCSETEAVACVPKPTVPCSKSELCSELFF
jgi:hypothetical protein